MQVKEKERAILVGIKSSRISAEEFAVDMEELQGLLEAAGGEVIASMVQAMHRPQAATYIGRGKLEELLHLVEELEPELVVFDAELSPMQLRNIEEYLKIKVVDRTMLILDIFSQRARSREGILQVELARLQYQLPRLTGQGKELSRTGAGIGTRGAGEQKLELDRRYIKKRIKDIKGQMEKAQKTRELHRKQRQRVGLKTVSLVGYTNAGKSSVFNSICELAHPSGVKQVEAENQLFQTLDTTTRKINLNREDSFLLSDTVGFIKNLPHHLVAAFKSTLEEAVQADLLIHVVDVSDPDYMDKMLVVQDVLQDLGAPAEDILTVFNKSDRLDYVPDDNRNLYISARTGIGLDILLARINLLLFKD